MTQRQQASLWTRTMMFILGVITMGLGIALSVVAGLGTAPVSTLPAVFAAAGLGSVGWLTVALNIIFLAVQVAVRRRNFRWIQLLQIPTAFLFGLSIDAWAPLLRWIDVTFYWQQAIVTVLGTVVLGIGVWLQVEPRVLIVPGEGVVLAISDTAGWRFGNVKISFDLSLVAIATVSSFLLLGGLHGVREGTVFGALVVGTVVKLCQRLVPQYGRWISPQPLR